MGKTPGGKRLDHGLSLERHAFAKKEVPSALSLRTPRGLRAGSPHCRTASTAHRVASLRLLRARAFLRALRAPSRVAARRLHIGPRGGASDACASTGLVHCCSEWCLSRRVHVPAGRAQRRPRAVSSSGLVRARLRDARPHPTPSSTRHVRGHRRVCSRCRETPRARRPPGHRGAVLVRSLSTLPGEESGPGSSTLQDPARPAAARCVLEHRHRGLQRPAKSPPRSTADRLHALRAAGCTPTTRRPRAESDPRRPLA